MTNPTLRLSLDIDPMPTPRPRARAFMVKGKPIVSMYHPKEYTEWQKEVVAAIAEDLAEYTVHPELPIAGPLTVGIIVSKARPKTTKLSAPRSDLDNFAKGILDAMTKAGVWNDDAQVELLAIKKQWADEPSVLIEVTPGVVG